MDINCDMLQAGVSLGVSNLVYRTESSDLIEIVCDYQKPIYEEIISKDFGGIQVSVNHVKIGDYHGQLNLFFARFPSTNDKNAHVKTFGGCGSTYQGMPMHSVNSRKKFLKDMEY